MLYSPSMSEKGIFELNNPKSSAGEITIITPENKTYRGPDSGYYPATFGFEDDNLNSLGEEISFVSIPHSIDPNTEVSIASEIDLHKNVLKITDDSNSGNVDITNKFIQNQSYGIVEFWVRNSNNVRSYIKITEGITQSDENQVDLSFNPSGTLDYYDTSWHPIQSISLNKWYHLKIEFNCSAKWHLWIDGIKKSGTGWDYWGSPSTLSSLHLLTEVSPSNYELYFDGFGYSWDPNYNIGDNIKEGLLLSYENTTALDWKGYSLDGQANKTILGNTTLPLPSDGQHRIQVFGNNSIGTMHESNLRHFTANTNPNLKIVTPENKTYYESTSGYYPATYGFENDKAGENPEFFTVDEAGGEVNIVDEVDGHKNIMGLFDEAGGAWPISYSTFDIPQTYGTYEYWVRTTNASNFQGLRLYSGAIIDTNVMVDFVIRGEKFQYYYNSQWHDVAACVDNQWYHIEIAFECTTGGYRGLSQYKFKVWIDGIDYGECGYWYNKPSATAIQFMGGSSLAKNLYVDAIGYSWDPQYSIGANLNEGLLLSYENSTAVDWQGYSLDGLTNKTLYGNTTIPIPVDGTHNIQVFGNNTMGVMYESDLRYFTVHTGAPAISINSPSYSQIIGMTAPNYDLSIMGFYDLMWYTLDGGANNITINVLSGTIDQAAWSALPDGIVSIIFYARNPAGPEGSAQVQVVKDSSEESPAEIPGFNIYWLLGVLGIVSVILIRKRSKS